MKNENVVELISIRKSFGEKMLFDGLTFSIPAAAITGIIGANGVGKSILLHMICGLVKPNSGRISVFGKCIGSDVDFPPRTGALIDEPGFLPDLSAYSNLKLLADISGKASPNRILEVLSIVGLQRERDQAVRTFSAGMRKRLGIAQAILEKPALLLLDEPTDSIDQAGWRGIYEYLIELKEEGTTILLTSNKQDEINILCDQAFLLENRNLSPITIR
ncbi:MAG: ATP-binding cassette domain-containing protein [Anaerolineae bacterium]|jgi:ABC-2 type transport system ATP-binding protein|nr:ATP-binding cassette domain-containing protein [Anaerolineae bacterium]